LTDAPPVQAASPHSQRGNKLIRPPRVQSSLKRRCNQGPRQPICCCCCCFFFFFFFFFFGLLFRAIHLVLQQGFDRLPGPRSRGVLDLDLKRMATAGGRRPARPRAVDQRELRCLTHPPVDLQGPREGTKGFGDGSASAVALAVVASCPEPRRGCDDHGGGQMRPVAAAAPAARKTAQARGATRKLTCWDHRKARRGVREEGGRKSDHGDCEEARSGVGRTTSSSTSATLSRNLDWLGVVTVVAARSGGRLRKGSGFYRMYRFECFRVRQSVRVIQLTVTVTTSPSQPP
jgi:hypothetical protein